MNQIINTEAIIIDKYLVGENDIWGKAFTKKYGKIDYLAKSARKPQAKLIYHLEPGNIVNLYLVPRKNNNGYVLTGIKQLWKADYNQLSKNKNKLIAGIFFLLNRLFTGDTLEEKIIRSTYRFSKIHLKRIGQNKVEEKRLLLFHLHYLVRLFEITGYSPNLKRCLFCNKAIQKASYYNPNEGGLSCCLPSDNSIKISFNSIKLLNYLKYCPAAKIKKIKLEPQAIKDSWKLVLNHLEYCIG